MSTAIIALGSNIEPRKDFLKKAIRKLEQLGKVEKISSLYESEALGFEAETSFLNAVLRLNCSLNPFELLQTLLQIEKNLGRTRTANGYESRKIDLDLIAYDQQVIISKNLILPHPEFRNRKFVLVPFAEIYSEYIDPLTQNTVSELLEKTDDESTIFVHK